MHTPETDRRWAMTAEQEAEAFAAWRSGDREAGERIARSVAYVVRQVDAKYRRLDVLADEVVGVAWMAVATAMRSFDPATGVRFSTYAFRAAVRRVSQFVAGHRHAVILHDRSIRKLRDGDLVLEDRRLDEPLMTHNGEAGESLGQLLADDARPVDDAATDAADVTALLDGLKPRDRAMVLRYVGHGETLEEIGDDYGLTRERVRQIVGVALRKMRRQRWPAQKGRVALRSLII